MIGREDKNGPQGDGINEDVSFTLNTVDRHAVYAMTTGSFTQVSRKSADRPRTGLQRPDRCLLRHWQGHLQPGAERQVRSDL